MLFSLLSFAFVANTTCSDDSFTQTISIHTPMSRLEFAKLTDFMAKENSSDFEMAHFRNLRVMRGRDKVVFESIQKLGGISFEHRQEVRADLARSIAADLTSDSLNSIAGGWGYSWGKLFFSCEEKIFSPDEECRVSILSRDMVSSEGKAQSRN